MCWVPAWRKAAAAARRPGFAAATQEQALAELYPGVAPRMTPKIRIEAFDLTEDGALVPLKIHAGLPRVRALTILVRDNPSPLLAVHRLGEGVEPLLELRIKMAQSSPVTVIAETEQGLFMNRRVVKVAVGGCGDP